jgi:Lon protease-like protein
VTGDGVNSSTCCNATKRLPTVTELQLAFNEDLKGHELEEVTAGDVNEEFMTRESIEHYKAASRKRQSASRMGSSMSLAGDSQNLLCQFSCFGELISEDNVAVKVLGGYGVRFFVEAVNPSELRLGEHWNFVDIFLEKCPEALLLDELRFIDVHKSSQRTVKSILALAIEAEPKKLKSVRAIVNCWIRLLNIKPDQAYDQVYLRSLFMPKEDVLLLAEECPQEFEHLLSELQVMHSHPMVYGDMELFHFLDHKAKVHGSHVSAHVALVRLLYSAHSYVFCVSYGV